jgi:subtilisin-like proprotein convertase family protein
MKAALLIVAGFAISASAQTVFYGGGLGGAIPDNGGVGSPLSSSIVIGDAGSITDIDLNLNGLSHTFVGDLIISLSNGSTSVELVNRPGVPDFSGFGWAYNLGGDYIFDDAAGVTWQDVNGNVQDTDFNIASGSYLGEQALSAFNGSSVAGTWTLSISDNAGADTGALGSWGVTITTIPAPAGLAILGLGGLAATRRRR